MGPNLAAALVTTQLEITNAPKNANNPFFNSKYTDLATAVNHCRPVLAKNGLAIIQTFGGNAEYPIVFTTIVHGSGEIHTSPGLMLKSEKPENPQKLASLLTYGRRISYLAMVGIAPEDDDANKAVPEEDRPKPRKAAPVTDTEANGDDMMITAPQLKKLNAMISEATIDRDKVKKFFKVASLKALTRATAQYTFDNWDKFLTKYQDKHGG